MTDPLPTNWIRRLGNTSVSTSAIIAGASPLGTMPPLYGYAVAEADAIDLVQQVLKSPILGLRYLQRLQRRRERAPGRAGIAAAGGVPEDFTVITEVDARHGDYSGDRVRRSLDESQERLGLGVLPLLS